MEPLSTSEGFFAAIGLSKLVNYWHVMVLTTVACQLIASFSRLASPILFPKTYGNLKGVKRLSWDMHVVSLVNCIVVSVLATPMHWNHSLPQDKLFGYNDQVGLLHSIASGYFLWDAFHHIKYVKDFGIGFAFHGVASLFLGVYSFVNTLTSFCIFRPFIMYYGCSFLMFELSTPFLNFHWFMDKLGYTGSMAQIVNGVILVIVFFFARLVWGFWTMYDLIVTVIPRLDQIPWYVTLFFGMAFTCLNLLNIYWFRKMILSVRARFLLNDKFNKNKRE
ncbi:DUF887-domain-containing protein [Basidiobolus meristosporus CBS 931.73]|uniref:DUF887-domain-containing protein n=1 Tax=Basidiobolus meristosporus CBS 931.73 TaxID=1314790 RepID=A0A1Y1XUQ5_9FUNG|nr:DUF887-domain-containing protein [Basidiobolus meristosporus CBS 931.73]|eukprot:ORX89507.1 DUF887-domain-containing protein [Basidiobolus meristosporus CBS 931.73]